MLSFFKFSDEIPDPVAARAVYEKQNQKPESNGNGQWEWIEDRLGESSEA